MKEKNSSGRKVTRHSRNVIEIAICLFVILFCCVEADMSDIVFTWRFSYFQMHLVHLRRNKSPSERANDEIGYAVVAVFFELGNVANHQLTPITNALQLVQAAGSKYRIYLPIDANMAGFVLQSQQSSAKACH